MIVSNVYLQIVEIEISIHFILFFIIIIFFNIIKVWKTWKLFHKYYFTIIVTTFQMNLSIYFLINDIYSNNLTTEFINSTLKFKQVIFSCIRMKKSIWKNIFVWTVQRKRLVFNEIPYIYKIFISLCHVLNISMWLNFRIKIWMLQLCFFIVEVPFL